MIPLAAYCGHLFARPGETIRFHCANTTGQDVSAQLLRVVSADHNPEGPGIITEPVDARIRPLAHAEPQAVPHGS
jgi:N,N-dimethylformamidase